MVRLVLEHSAGILCAREEYRKLAQSLSRNFGDFNLSQEARDASLREMNALNARMGPVEKCARIAEEIEAAYEIWGRAGCKACKKDAKDLYVYTECQHVVCQTCLEKHMTECARCKKPSTVQIKLEM